MRRPCGQEAISAREKGRARGKGAGGDRGTFAFVEAAGER